MYSVEKITKCVVIGVVFSWIYINQIKFNIKTYRVLFINDIVLINNIC